MYEAVTACMPLYGPAVKGLLLGTVSLNTDTKDVISMKMTEMSLQCTGSVVHVRKYGKQEYVQWNAEGKMACEA